MCVSTHISFRVGKANDSAALAPRATAPGMEPLGSQALIALTATGSQVAIDDKVHGTSGNGNVGERYRIGKNDKVLGARTYRLGRLPGCKKSELCRPHHFFSTIHRFNRWWSFSSKSIKPTWLQTLPFRMYITTLARGRGAPGDFVIFPGSPAARRRPLGILEESTGGRGCSGRV